MQVSRETPFEIDARIRQIIRLAVLDVFEGTYAFREQPVHEPPVKFSSDALAYVRDDEVWSCLVPSTDPHDSLTRVFRFHFPDGLDNSGFIGWLAAHLKARFGTGVFVVCGQNSERGGIFDYWGCPVEASDEVLQEVRNLNHSVPVDLHGPARSLDGVRMRVVATAATGEVNESTVLQFAENGSLVTAGYAGGGIRAGFLAGIRVGRIFSSGTHKSMRLEGWMAESRPARSAGWSMGGIESSSGSNGSRARGAARAFLAHAATITRSRVNARPQRLRSRCGRADRR